MGVTFLAISSVAFTQEQSSEHLWIQSKRVQEKEAPKVASVANCIIGLKSVSLGQGERKVVERQIGVHNYHRW